MRESTGELSSSVIVIGLVGALIGIFYYTAWPTIRNNFIGETSCDKATCESTPDSKGMVNCKYKEERFKCKYKG